MVQIHRAQHSLMLEGELTIYHVAEARILLKGELARDPSMEVDLSGIEELDTAGVQLLLWLKREAVRRGESIPFLHHSPAVLEVFDQLNLAGVFGDTLVIAPTV